jgi:hypothetical protein
MPGPRAGRCRSRPRGWVISGTPGLRRYARDSWWAGLAGACAAAAGLGSASLVLRTSARCIRDRRQRRVPRARVLQGTSPGTADQHRCAGRPGRVSADGPRVRGRQGRDSHDAAIIETFTKAHRLPGMAGDATRTREWSPRPAIRRSRTAACGSSSACGSRTSPSIRKFVRTARRYRAITI